MDWINLKRCSVKSDHIKKGNCMYSTGLLKWIIYSRAVYATKISNAKERVPFEFTYSWRRYFPPFITHRGTFCSPPQGEAGRQVKSQKNKSQNKSCRSITFHFLLLGHALSSLLCRDFHTGTFLFPHRRYFPSSPSHWKPLLPLAVPSVSPGGRLTPQVLMVTAYDPKKHPLCPPHRVSDTQ